MHTIQLIEHQMDENILYVINLFSFHYIINDNGTILLALGLDTNFHFFFQPRYLLRLYLVCYTQKVEKNSRQ